MADVELALASSPLRLDAIVTAHLVHHEVELPVPAMDISAIVAATLTVGEQSATGRFDTTSPFLSAYTIDPGFASLTLGAYGEGVYGDDLYGVGAATVGGLGKLDLTDAALAAFLTEPDLEAFDMPEPVTT